MDAPDDKGEFAVITCRPREVLLGLDGICFNGCSLRYSTIAVFARSGIFWVNLFPFAKNDINHFHFAWKE
jgi:hypothetical protein